MNLWERNKNDVKHTINQAHLFDQVTLVQNSGHSKLLFRTCVKSGVWHKRLFVLWPKVQDLNGSSGRRAKHAHGWKLSTTGCALKQKHPKEQQEAQHHRDWTQNHEHAWGVCKTEHKRTRAKLVWNQTPPTLYLKSRNLHQKLCTILSTPMCRWMTMCDTPSWASLAFWPWNPSPSLGRFGPFIESCLCEASTKYPQRFLSCKLKHSLSLHFLHCLGVYI